MTLFRCRLEKSHGRDFSRSPEVVRKGYESKDLEIGPPFYLSQGIEDVIVFGPMALLVLRVRKDRAEHQVSPVTLEPECACSVTV